MSQYYFKTNSEMVKCVNCGNTDFRKNIQENGETLLAYYECQRCHFISWFPGEFAPTDTATKKD